VQNSVAERIVAQTTDPARFFTQTQKGQARHSTPPHQPSVAASAPKRTHHLRRLQQHHAFANGYKGQRRCEYSSLHRRHVTAR
jgi:hypothetical protein